MTFLEQCDRFLDITRNRPLDTLCTSHDRWHYEGLPAGGDFGRAFVPAAETIDRRRNHRVMDLPRLKPEKSRHIGLTDGGEGRALSQLRRAA